jgi:hypothetical protein
LAPASDGLFYDFRARLAFLILQFTYQLNIRVPSLDLGDIQNKSFRKLNSEPEASNNALHSHFHPNTMPRKTWNKGNYEFQQL